MEQRSALIDLVTAGRATVREAASRLGVPTTTAYHWLSQAASRRRRGAEQPAPARRKRQVAPTFVQLVRAGDLAATVVVRVGGAEVAVRHGFDAELLRAVVGALGGAAG